MTEEQKKQYVSNVYSDFAELKEEYPFSSILVIPYSEIQELSISVIAVNKRIIDEMNAKKSDFIGEFSKEIFMKVPFDYRNTGCKIYGGKWIKYESLKSDKDRHFYKGNEKGYEFCLGVPQSFPKMKNVLLECVKTADNMLVAYEQVKRNPNMKLQLNSYSHGAEGINEYRADRRKYISE